MLATGCPPVTSITTDFGDFPLVGRDLAVDGVPVGLGPRWAALDAVLVEAAVDARAELRESFPVHELVYDEGRVAGVRSGTQIERARLVIGAVPDYHENFNLARLGPFPTEVRDRRAAIRGDDEATRGFYLASEGLA